MMQKKLIYDNCQNYRALIGSQLLSTRVQTMKMTSDVTRAFKSILLVLFPCNCKKFEQLLTSFMVYFIIFSNAC